MNHVIGSPPAPSFDDPLGMLRACHGRIQAQCTTLKKLLAHLPAHGCDTQAQQAAQAILRYFDTAGRHHHDDEERDLFPLLHANGDDAARMLVARLLNEHKEMDAAWHEVRPYLANISQGASSDLDAATVEHFIGVYDRHIAVENSQLLPLALRVLDREQLRALGRSMAARRMS